jgi:hypothetical protein
MAGVHLSVVDAGIKNLVEGRYFLNETNQKGESLQIPLLEREKTTEGTRHFYLYRSGFVRDIEKWHGMFFIFHTCIVTSGVWSELSPRAKALYLAMRSVAKFDPYNYMEIEYGEQLNDVDFNFNSEDYRERKWDICLYSLAQLCRMVNIDSSKIKPVLDQLKKYHLVEIIDNGMYKVFLKPRIKQLLIKD